ncbi:hypothetical protein UY3_07749 [Chelonia mydas]|uniref:Uncharacterized protein n=1 Tax=Chelonia mydas TaxID=8469 RepID=M7BHI2_CHEMY|nr:hypothetical protein UY3_07749 [Chelonia mydas]
MALTLFGLVYIGNLQRCNFLTRSVKNTPLSAASFSAVKRQCRQCTSAGSYGPHGDSSPLTAPCRPIQRHGCTKTGSCAAQHRALGQAGHCSPAAQSIAPRHDLAAAPSHYEMNSSLLRRAKLSSGPGENTSSFLHILLSRYGYSALANYMGRAHQPTIDWQIFHPYLQVKKEKRGQLDL